MNESILKTLSYAHVFNFPLTKDEIHQRLISTKTTPKTIKTRIKKLKIKSYKGYYYLGNKRLVESRIKNKSNSKRKITKANKIAKILKIFPSIQAVVITGAVAVNNPKNDDDIDFLIITKGGTLWITRILVNIFLDIFNIRRTPSSKVISNKACLNLWLTNKSLQIPSERRNLYTAHEVILTKLAWDRNQTYNQFLSINKWVLNYLPNQPLPKLSKIKPKKSIFSPLNKLAYKLQSKLMKPKQTRETTSEEFAFFHPRDTQKHVENKFNLIYKKALKTYKHK